MKNIAEILRAYFKANEPIYSPVCGEVTDWYVKANGDIVMSKCDTTYTFDEYGRMDEFGDCLVFPSKDKQSWDDLEIPFKFKPKDWVLMKFEDGLWTLCQYSHEEYAGNTHYYIAVGSGSFTQCIPYDDNKELLGHR